MRFRRGDAFYRYFEELSRGDPWAVGLTIVFGVLFALVGLVYAVDAWNQRKERRNGRSRR